MAKKKSDPPRRKPIRMKTIGYSEPYIYSITICTAKREPLFENPDYVKIFINELLDYCKRYNMLLYAYCILPDHIHLLIQPEGETSVIKFVNTLKGRTTFLLRRQGCKGGVWQRSFYDHIIRSSENLEEVVRYILENPVRKELVDSFHKYEWSGDAFGIKDIDD